MGRNDYKGVLADWKLEIIEEQIRYIRFRPHDRDDAMQEAVMAALKFKYDPSRADEMSEKVAFRWLIRRNLLHIRRTMIRSSAKQQRIRDELSQLAHDVETDPNAITDLSADMKKVLNRLPPLHRAFLDRLAKGESVTDISEETGISRYFIAVALEGAKKALKAAGVE